MVGLAVSLADKDTLADKSSLEFVANHCKDPSIPRKVANPLESSLCSHLTCGDFGYVIVGCG